VVLEVTVDRSFVFIGLCKNPRHKTLGHACAGEFFREFRDYPCYTIPVLAGDFSFEVFVCFHKFVYEPLNSVSA
jgi:hypothetical protein